jgi:hypothetical protein
MMNLRQRSVNVKRVELLEALKKNLEIHRAEYKEALVDFKTRLLEDLEAGAKHVADTTPAELAKFSVRINFPQNHEKDFEEVIEMLELSVDEHINLDSESFKAYFKNEWSWTHTFELMNASYKAGGSMLSL